MRVTQRSLEEWRSIWEKSDSMKVEVEELESLLGPEDSEVDFRRILEEARNKRSRAIFETFSSEGPSAMERAPMEAGYAEGGVKKNDAYAAANIVLFDERKTVASGSGRAAESLEQSGKKGNGCNGKLLGKKRRYKSGDCGFGAVDGARRSTGLLEVHPEACNEERQQHFRYLRHKREK